VTDRLGRLLLVTLEAARLNADLPVLGALRSWLNSWRGIGDVERGMARQGFDLQLTRYDASGWRSTFYTIGMEHSPTSTTGLGSKVGDVTGGCNEDTFTRRSGKYGVHLSACARHRGGGR
jgi:hypothetical protein